MQHHKLKKTSVTDWPNLINYPLIVIWKYKTGVWLTLWKSAPGFPLSLIMHLPPFYPGLAFVPENTQQRTENKTCKLTLWNCISNTHSFCYSKIFDLQRNIPHCVKIESVFGADRSCTVPGSTIYLVFWCAAFEFPQSGSLRIYHQSETTESTPFCNSSPSQHRRAIFWCRVCEKLLGVWVMIEKI